MNQSQITAEFKEVKDQILEIEVTGEIIVGKLADKYNSLHRELRNLNNDHFDLTSRNSSRGIWLS